ncbi:CRISPR-associated protein Cas4 [Treponema primitia]|uniref:CRISPR-associated protein Cas4 n=1 Tax=Treponema primitia TaxID=88058 RepID=UPI00025558BA|nr:CRISPR-associated protein Cas4 [Treponema primitia]
MYSEDNLIPISALQHVLFCERQYALIHLEQIWEENQFTAEGKVLHERVDAEHHESRRLFRQEYGMAVRSLEQGLIGKCDLVELWYTDGGGVKRVSPVEFKRGREKESDVDRIQLCAQALCLEEMFKTAIESGQLYYLQEHRRVDVILGGELREKTQNLTERIRAIQQAGKTPAAEYEMRKCDRCSLVDICMPKTSGTASKKVDRFIQTQLRLMKNGDGENEEAS